MPFSDLTEEEVSQYSYLIDKEQTGSARRKAGAKKGGQKTSRVNRTFVGRFRAYAIEHKETL